MQVLKEISCVSAWKDSILLSKDASIEEMRIETRESITSLPKEYIYMETEIGNVKIKSQAVYKYENNEALGKAKKSYSLHISEKYLYNYKVEESLLTIYMHHIDTSGKEAQEKKVSLDIDSNAEAEKQLFCFTGDTLYYIRKNEIHKKDLEDNEDKLVSVLPNNIAITCMCCTKTHIIIGVSTGALAFVNLLTGSLQHTAWHSSAITSICAKDRMCVSVSKEGHFLLTDINTLKNTFITSTKKEIQMVHISPSGYLVFKTNTNITTIDLAAKKKVYEIFLIYNSTPSIQTEDITEVVQEYYPEFENFQLQNNQVYNTPSKDIVTEEGIAYLLDNQVVFISPKIGVYRVHTEPSKIKAFSLNGNTLYITLNKSEEESSLREKEVPLTEELVYKMYSLRKNTTLLLHKEYLNNSLSKS